MGFPISSTRECVAPFGGADCPGMCQEDFADVAALRLDGAKKANKWAFVRGGDVIGIWIYNTTSIEADNGASVIRTNDVPASKPGRYLKWL